MASLVVALRADRGASAGDRRALHARVTDWWTREAARRLPTCAVTVLVADHDQRPILGGDDPAVAPMVDVVVIAVDVVRPTDPADGHQPVMWARAVRDAQAWAAAQAGAWHGRAFVRAGDLVGGPLGAPAPGVEQVALMGRSSALDHEAFVAHWTERHAPLALTHHVGMSRYVQHVIDAPVPLDVGAGDWPQDEVDGVAELQFATEADFRDRFYDSPEGAEVIMADVGRFLDLTATRGALVTPTVVAAG